MEPTSRHSFNDDSYSMQPTFYKRKYEWSDGAELVLGERTLIMGILNVTPDSFSDGGKHNNVTAALAHVENLIQQGVDIIDIGGESTRPGFTPISVDEELSRVMPVIEAIRKQYPKLVLSIDTYKSETADVALEAGVHILNDIWCLKHDPNMAQVAAKHQCIVILNHNRLEAQYREVVADTITDLQESIKLAHLAGVKDNNIWLDPGIGFAKNYEENLEVHARLNELNQLGYPVLLGTSRKKFIRHALGMELSDIDEGTIASNVIGIAQGCQIVRVHDVLAMKKAALMADALLYRLNAYRER